VFTTSRWQLLLSAKLFIEYQGRFSGLFYEFFGLPMIDLRSDTVTKPTSAMREAMFNAELGDDVYGEDPTVNQLEQVAADTLGKEAGLFAPSGTQSNLLALLTHCGRGDEYIVGNNAHTYRYEGGGAAALGGIQPQPVSMASCGELDLQELEDAIKPNDFHFARSRIICLENTHGGSVLSQQYCAQVRELSQRFNLSLHLDGARLFNAAVAQEIAPETLAEPFSSVSICLSKGLGAPVGSVLVGSKTFINEARRWRKVVGGGMRQAGILAAAGIYALENHVTRLAVDHANAETVQSALANKFGSSSVRCATNMLHLSLSQQTYFQLSQHLAAAAIQVGRQRWVFHLDISEQAVTRLCTAIESFQPAT
jgi:threonine aldolase